ncbi:MAG: protein-L-isoaspartate(D-aspartate) O-methyltransferase, partial [Gammaproteobacteria bacterium]|nr:protein-L-isoaspartate(D-aspartate) O-methyltransferase [Gammaproteobacteria bacterium]
MTSSQHAGIGMTSARTRERLVQRLQQQGIDDARVLDRIRTVPRHLFVDEALSSRAYEDTALPIGFGQTISQPYVVAKMTSEMIKDGPKTKILEVGTGCGYQAAVISPFTKELCTIERIQPLSQRARDIIRELNIHNVRVRFGDGYQGWPGKAPFDGILLTAAPEQVPQALFDQLADGGILIAPVGAQRDTQRLLKYRRQGNTIEKTEVGLVSFV